MKLTYYGHACFGVNVQGYQLLFDPFIVGNERASGINVDTVPADYIFVSHGHADHIGDTQRIAQRTGATVVGSWEVCEWLSSKGLNNIHPMNVGGRWQFDFGMVRCTVAHHSSSLPDGSYGGNPMGFVVQAGKSCFYYAGDTALTLDMKLLPMLGYNFNFVVLPVGDNFTMGYQDAVMASDFLECNLVVGVHFDTFGYIQIDHDAAKRAFAVRGKELILPRIGETVHL